MCIRDRRKTPAYEVLQRDQTAHVVYDKKTGITAYAAFEAYQPADDKVFVAIPAETMVMYAKESDKGIRLSAVSYTHQMCIRDRLYPDAFGWQYSSRSGN